MVAKVASDQAKPNGVLWVLPGEEAAISGAARRAQDSRRRQGHRKESARLRHPQSRRPGARSTKISSTSASASGDSRWPENRAAWMRAAGSTAKSARTTIRSRSATSTRSTKTPPTSDMLESTLARLSEMVGRRLREHQLYARTIQLKLRYSDFTTITRAHSLDHATQLDTEIFREVARSLPQELEGRRPRCGCSACTRPGSKSDEGQLNLLGEDKTERWRKALAAVDQIRDKFGEDSVSLARDEGPLRERVHENPAGLPGKTPRERAGQSGACQLLNYYEAHLEMKQLIEDIAKALVDLPDQVIVREVRASRSPCWSYESLPPTWGR